MLATPAFLNGSAVAGAQSVGVTTTFDLEPVFQLGQVEACRHYESCS